MLYKIIYPLLVTLQYQFIDFLVIIQYFFVFVKIKKAKDEKKSED